MDPNELRQKAKALIDKADAIEASAEAMGRSLNEGEEEKVDELHAEAEGCIEQAEEVEERERQAVSRTANRKALRDKLTAKPGRKVAPESPAATVEVSEPNFTKDPMKGFDSPREFFETVVQIGRNGSDPRASDDDRVKFLATAGTDEMQGDSDPYGGLFVPIGMSPNLLQIGADANPLMERATRIPMDTKTVEINARVDKDHSTSVSGGFTVSRKAETAAAAASRGEFEQVELKATSLFGFGYATEELLRDSPRSVAAIIEAGFREEFPSQHFLDMLAGTGVGEPEGVKNASATVAVAKESGQTADTINGTNLLKMRQRAWRYGNSVWLANHDTYLQLNSAHTTLTNDDRPLFSHGNGTDVPDTLLGRPIFFSEYAETIGDNGDIYLLDMSQYLYGVYQPFESAESVHVRFERHERAFKFWMRDAGAPWWRSALTPKKGANTLSPFVTLAARA